MKIPIEWLKEYISFKNKPKDIAEKLTLSGIEIESITHESFEKVIIGEIIDIKKHPQADKLQIASVNIGPKLLQIVCGANNIEIGQKVPVALVGATLGEMEIKKATIRGVESEGILCSETELSISDNHTGIMILDPRAKIGAKLVTALDIGGIVLDAEINPNREDLLSILGIARELKVILGQKIKEPKLDFSEVITKTSDYIKVDVANFNLCPRYIARVVEINEICESPEWIQDRISACGIRPINAVVDITNYVMLEYGQPLHAFDGEKIEGKKIIVRPARGGEKIQTLDGVDRKLKVENLVIADSKKPIAIAGVMGGTNSEVDLSSKIIVLESAKFNKVSVRRTGNSLTLRTEAVLRFEKEVPFDLPEIAVERVCTLLQEVCGAKVYKGQLDIYKEKTKPRKVTLDISKVEKILGIKIAKEKILNILKSLGFLLKESKNQTFSFLVPWWRLDISIPEDLIEEIARIYGYDKIPKTLPSGELPVFAENWDLLWSNNLKKTLVDLGFFEVYTYSFIGKSLLEKAGVLNNNYVEIKNPITPEQAYMRQALTPSLLEVASKNLVNFDQFKIFELAKIYYSKKNSFIEEKRINGLVVSKREDAFFETKDVIKMLLQNLGIFYEHNSIQIEPPAKEIISKESVFHAGRVAQLRINNEFIGLFGEANSQILEKFNIKKRVGLFSLSLEKLLNYATTGRTYTPVSKFPSSRFDLAIVVNKDVPEVKIRKAIIASSLNLLYKIELFDIYSGKQLGKDKKNLAYHLTLQSQNHTLEEKEINNVRTKIISSLKNNFKAEIRER